MESKHQLLQCCFLALFVGVLTLEPQGRKIHSLHSLVKRQAGLSSHTGNSGVTPSYSQQSGTSYRSRSQTSQQLSGRSGLSSSSSSSSTGQRQFVSPDGQPYYVYQPHISTSRGLGSGQAGGSSSSSSVSSSSSSSSSTTSRRRTDPSRVAARRHGSTTGVLDGSVRPSGRTYNYPFGRERVQYQYSAGSQNGTGGAGSHTGGVTDHQARLSGTPGQNPGSRSVVTGSVSGSGVRTSSASSTGGVSGTSTQSGTRWRVAPQSNNGRRIVANRRTRVNVGSQGSAQQRGHSSQQVPSRRPPNYGSYNTPRPLTGRRTVSSVASQNPGANDVYTFYGVSSSGQSGTSRQSQTGTSYQQGTRTRQQTPQRGGSGVQTRRVLNPTPDRRSGQGQTHYRRTRVIPNRRQSTTTGGQGQGSPTYGARTQSVYSQRTNQRPGFRATLQQVNPQAGTAGSGTTRYYNPQTGAWQTVQTYPGFNSQSQGGRTYIQPSYNPYNPATSGSSGCPETGIELRIDGMSCQQAVQHHGAFVCYTHEYTSRECCEVCRPRRQADRIGCEYGDHAPQCRTISAADCYDLRNRQTCCQACERLRIQNAQPGCEYGDMTEQCNNVRQNPGLCYIPDNQRLCCNSCHTAKNHTNPSCPWGDYNSELCQLFDEGSTNVRINCYSPHRRRICCQSCERLRQWVPDDVPAECEYGDRPVVFSTDQLGRLNCSTVLQHFSANECHTNTAVSVNCCHTCHRYWRSRPRG